MPAQFFFFIITIFIAIPDLNTNSVDPDQTPSSAASDLDRNCLPMSIFSRRPSDCILFLFFTKSWIWHFMQIVSIRDTLHKNVKSCFLGRIRKNITKCRLLKILPRVLSVMFFFSVSVNFTLADVESKTFADDNK